MYKGFYDWWGGLSYAVRQSRVTRVFLVEDIIWKEEGKNSIKKKKTCEPKMGEGGDEPSRKV